MTQQSVEVESQAVMDVIEHFNQFIGGKTIPNIVDGPLYETVVAVALASTRLNIAEPGTLLRLLAMGVYLAEIGKTHLTHAAAAVH